MPSGLPQPGGRGYLRLSPGDTWSDPEARIFPQETGCMGLNDRCDLISSFEKVIQDMNKLGRYDLQMFYMRNMNTYLNASSKHK